MILPISFHLEIEEMEYSDGEIELITESVVNYQWKVNGEPQPQVTGNVLSLENNEFVAEGENDQKVEVEVTLQSECGASITQTFIVIRDLVETTPTGTPSKCKSESKH